MEQTLIIIKPDAVARKLVGAIFQRFEQKQLTIRQLSLGTMSRETAEKHYDHIRQYAFFEEMMAYMTESEVIYAVLEGEEAIAVVRKMIGATNCIEAEPGTIRGDYGGKGFRNIIHASDSVESAALEIHRFFHQ